MDRDNIRRFAEAEVRCYHCGRVAGSLREELGVRGSVPTFRASVGRPEMLIRTLACLRCTRCSGSLYIDHLEVVERFDIAAGSVERPRRGRPPKRLLEVGERKLA